jgi:hypothetical protein
MCKTSSTDEPIPEREFLLCTLIKFLGKGQVHFDAIKQLIIVTVNSLNGFYCNPNIFLIVFR